jgi:hypothetical protein
MRVVASAPASQPTEEAMHRAIARLLAVVAFGAALAAPAIAQEAQPETPEQAAAKRIGFYFGLRLSSLSLTDPARNITSIVDTPVFPGLDPIDPTTGKQVDVDFGARLNLEFFVGFRLRKAGSVEASFLQWDEKQDLRQDAPAGKSFYNTLASPSAGIDEDLDQDGDVTGIEAGPLSENDLQANGDSVSDGAEDINFDGIPERLRFDTSQRIVGQASTDYQLFDVDYRRPIKNWSRFHLDWRAGLRLASLSQTYDIAYQQPGSFAVFVDDEADILAAQFNCGAAPPFGRTPNNIQDGDGDGEIQTSQNEADGDGFLDGNCNGDVHDHLESVATLSEDRVVARIKSRGYGVKAGLDARLDLSKNGKWRLTGSVAVSALSTSTDMSYRETFTSERDRYLDFIDWDFNHDGVYDNHDLDFDGSCALLTSAQCVITAADADALPGQTLGILFRDGIASSVKPNARGMNPLPYAGTSTGSLREGDPVGESERNSDILRETSLLTDVSGSASGIKPMLDLSIGLEWQFSRFAHLGVGVRSSTWYDAGKFRDLADDVAAGRGPQGSGDFETTGGYFALTIVPR